ncbi:MAG TPA: bifunctional UDP-sugar hydrolase/5'-nucleotidase [Caulobacteraceae bacterium]|jgi:5'-nucleotidase
MKRLIWLAGLASACVAGAALAETQSLTILHDNDVHGHLRSFCYVEVAKGPAEHCEVGGAARRATLVKRLRAEAKAPTLLLDSGDTSTRGPLLTQYEGLDEVAAMNAIGYDLAAIGNNEFKLKDAADAHDAAGAQAALAKLVAASRFPWICANATRADGSPLPGVKPFIVKRIGKLRVAFLGLTTGRSAAYPQARGLKIIDPVEAAKAWIPRARAEADVLIAVTHDGVADDQRLVHQTTGIDAVVGGDSHTYLYQPLIWKNAAGQDTPIVQDGEFGVRLGVFHLTFEGDAAHGWRLATYDDALLPVDAAIRPDPKVAALVERYARPLDVRVGEIERIGATPAERAALTAEDLAYAWKAAAGTEVGLQPEGDLFEVFRTHAVTRFQVHAILPFHDTIWKGEVSGAKLKAALEHPSPFGGVMHATIAAADIDPARTYSVATTDFVAQAAIPGGADTHQDAREAVEAWLKSKPGR